MKVRNVLIAILAVAASIPPVIAHHSLSASFDPDKRVTLSGTVTNIDWMNPHAYFFVDVKDATPGKFRSWACELASPNELSRRGFVRGSLKVGMSVTVVGTRAKDGSFKLHLDTLTADNSILIGK